MSQLVAHSAEPIGYAQPIGSIDFSVEPGDERASASRKIGLGLGLG